MMPIILITKMEGGGMETFCLELLRAWRADGTDCTLYTSYAGGVREGDVPDGVERVCWNLRALKSFVPLMKWLRSRPDDPCLCLSQELAVVLAVLKRLHLIRNRVYLRESTDVAHHYSPRFHRLMRLLWPALDGLIEQSRIGTEITRRICGRIPPVLLVRNLMCIGSDPMHITARKFELSDPVRFVCVGSFKPMKGQRFLLDELEKGVGGGVGVGVGVGVGGGAWRLTFFGNGERREECEAFVREKGLGDRIRFEDWTNDRDRIYRDADVVVMPSDYEGLPNVMLEAFIGGVRVSVRPTCTGATELLDELGLPETWPPEKALAIADDVWRAAREKLIPLCDSVVRSREIRTFLTGGR